MGQPLDPAVPFHIVMNGRSGHRDPAETMAAIRHGLAAADRAFHLHVVDDASRLAETAASVVATAKAEGGVVVAAGGDGTLNTVAHATLGSGCTYGVLPQGTFNYFGRSHGIPEDTPGAVANLLTGHPRPVQVGLLNERVFLVNASIGLYPRVLQDREMHKRRYGRSRLVALWAALSTLLGTHRRLALMAEGGVPGDTTAAPRHLRTPTLFVCNNRLQLETVGIDEAHLVDGGGQLVAIAPMTAHRVHLLWLLLRGAVGRLGDADSVQSFAFERIVLKPAHGGTRRPVKVATDGEVAWMRMPLVFSVAPDRLPLIVPAPRGDNHDHQADAIAAANAL